MGPTAVWRTGLGFANRSWVLPSRIYYVSRCVEGLFDGLKGGATDRLFTTYYRSELHIGLCGALSPQRGARLLALYPSAYEIYFPLATAVQSFNYQSTLPRRHAPNPKLASVLSLHSHIPRRTDLMPTDANDYRPLRLIFDVTQLTFWTKRKEETEEM